MPSQTEHKPEVKRSRLRGRCATAAALAAAIAVVAAAPAQAADRTTTFGPVKTTKRMITFRPAGVDAARIVDAQASFYASKRARRRDKELHRQLGVTRVRAAIRSRRALRLHKPAYARRGSLELTFEGDNDNPGVPENCAFDGGALSAAGCQALFEDTGVGDPAAVWGSVDCETQSRVSSPDGGDPSAMAGGTSQPGGDAFRRMTVFDGDDFWGERCELGLNDHRRGPTALYHEGERRITFFSARLPESYPLGQDRWQTVMQMKQAQPAANGGGAPVLELNARGGSWLLVNDWDGVWTVPAQQGTWTRFAFDVRYSQDPNVGQLTAYVDLNGDGDALDPQEQSPTLHLSTLRRETEGGSSTDGIAPGESIPSHLRMGVYHDPGIACGAGCAVDIDNVEVVAPS